MEALGVTDDDDSGEEDDGEDQPRSETKEGLGEAQGR